MLTERATHDVELLADLVYTVSGGRPRLLDLYLPSRVPRPLPLIVWLHAGGWRSGNRKQAPDLSRHFARRGFAMASIDYRLSGEATFPAPLHDVKAAIRWLRANAGGYGIDGSRIGLWGASAGGHLATLAALTPDDDFGRRDEGANGRRDLPAGVQAVVTAYAPMDFLQMDAQRDDAVIAEDDPSAFVLPPGARTSDARSYESLLIGAPIHDRPDLARAASPLTYVAAGAPPFLIVHGRSDRAVPARQSELLYEALARRGSHVTLHLVDGKGHGFLERVDAEPTPTLSVIEAFFRRHLTDTTFDRHPIVIPSKRSESRDLHPAVIPSERSESRDVHLAVIPSERSESRDLHPEHMTDLVTTIMDGDVAVLRIDSPPVNALDAAVREALASALRRVDARARAVVIACAGRTFVAGADIAELERAAWSDGVGPDLHPLLAQVEDFPKPIVAAIHGTALGGGLELAMACHYRVAVESARLGLPEVTLGIIPGAEGTQRLPRLVGVEKALDMGLSGRPITAPDALASGLINRIVDDRDLVAAATAFARESLDRGEPHPRTRERSDRLGTPAENAPILEAARASVRRTKPHIPAAALYVDAVEAAATLPFDAGCRRERELSVESVRSEPCKALLHVFLAERAATRVPDVTRETPSLPVNHVAIVGAGTMGGGIAMACANAGITVHLIDATTAALETGMDAVRRNYAASVKRGRMTEQAVAERLARIHPQLDAAGFDEADLVIEAVFESMELKRRIFAELDRVTRSDCVLATNTSTLDIDAIASATSRPERVVGLHFFSPANVMRLLEIVRGAATAPEVLATTLALAKRLGKVGVVVRNLPGFVGNRMMFPYMYETQFLVEEGATPEQVDRVLTRWGMAMGMFAVDDMAGLDVAWRVRQELGHFRDPAVRRPLVADQLHAMGRFGQKTGKGWFLYSADVGGGRTPIPDPEVLDLIARTASDAGIVRRTISDEEIVERSIYALINEGARVLEDGGAVRASDIDVVYVNGYGFPGWRGGPMFHADRVGLRHIHERIAAFHRELGPRWAPAPLLARLAREERTFRELDAEGAESMATPIPA